MGKVRVDFTKFGQSSGKVRAKFGQVQADFRQSSGGQVRAKFGQSGQVWAGKLGQVRAKFGQVWAKFGQTSGKVRG